MNTIDTDTYEYYIREDNPWRKATTADIIGIIAQVNVDDDYILKGTPTPGFYKQIVYSSVPISDADFIMSGHGYWAVLRIPKAFLDNDSNCFETMSTEADPKVILFNIPQELYEENDEMMQIF